MGSSPSFEVYCSTKIPSTRDTVQIYRVSSSKIHIQLQKGTFQFLLVDSNYGKSATNNKHLIIEYLHGKNDKHDFSISETHLFHIVGECVLHAKKHGYFETELLHSQLADYKNRKQNDVYFTDYLKRLDKTVAWIDK
jgi:hypothetical protein